MLVLPKRPFNFKTCWPLSSIGLERGEGHPDAALAMLRNPSRKRRQVLTNYVNMMRSGATVITVRNHRDEGDSKNALLEVRSGSGGDEAAAFAKELFEMYRRFAELKGWKFEGMTCSSIDAGKSEPAI